MLDTAKQWDGIMSLNCALKAYTTGSELELTLTNIMIY